MVGITTTGAVFFANEMFRITMRSPLFRLKIQNTLFWLIAPSFISRYYYSGHVDERVDNIWRIHRNRVDRGKHTFI